MSQSNLDTTPSVSTAIRSSNSFEASRNLSSNYGRQGSFGRYGSSRFLGEQGGFMGAQNTKGDETGN